MISRGQLAPCQESWVKRQQTVSSAGCKVLAPNAGFLLASMLSYCRFRPIECCYSQSVSVSVPQDKFRGSAIVSFVSFGESRGGQERALQQQHPFFLRLADHLVAFWATPGPQPQADLPPKPVLISLGLSFGPTLFSIFHLPHGPQRRCVPHASPTQPAVYTN